LKLKITFLSLAGCRAKFKEACALVCLFFATCTIVNAQSGSVKGQFFRDFNKHDTVSVFLENEPRPLLKEGDSTYSITITVTNIRNKKGFLRFKFYDDATAFPHDLGFLRIIVPKTKVENGTMTVTYHGFDSRYMGIALLDDEDGDMKLDFGWIFPSEGHAFSDYNHTSLLVRPTYADFRFLLKGNKKVMMKMKYY
jgi:uncharacterized protein (DUF2141 family)